MKHKAVIGLIEGRIPPQCVEIESQVIGAMLLDREAIPVVVEILDEDSFHADYHRKIFQAVMAMFERSEPVDIITLSEELRKRGHLETVGGGTYLAQLTTEVSNAANVEHHAKIVLEAAIRRKIISTASGIIQRSYDRSEDTFDLVDDFGGAAYSLAENKFKGNTFCAADKAVRETVEWLESIHGRQIVGVPSGFKGLDDLTGGWQDTDLILIAGRTSSGKTSFALKLAYNAALHKDKPTGVGIFSLEMSTKQLILRLLCADARVDAHLLRTGKLPEADWLRLARSAGHISTAPVWIDDSPTLTVTDLRAKARRLKSEKNIGLIIVDYLQLMKPTKEMDTREREVSSISRGLKALAKELNVPVIALSQMTRPKEEKEDKRPRLASLRDSGALEQDADVVVFVHRPEQFGLQYYDDEKSDPTAGTAEIIVAKQRNGPLDDVRVAFIHRYASFEALAKDAVPQAQDELAF